MIPIYNSDIHHRRSIRLQGYDYRQAGAYFVTICAQNRACLFGEIVNDTMQLNDAGIMLARHWQILPQRFTNIRLDAFVVMPNHIHSNRRKNRAINRGNPSFAAQGNHKGCPYVVGRRGGCVQIIDNG